eukprot:Colp12_sorted_trinity150504_noHs@7190
MSVHPLKTNMAAETKVVPKKFLGRLAVTFDKYDDIVELHDHPDLTRGTESRIAPGILLKSLETIFLCNEQWFFGQQENDGAPERVEISKQDLSDLTTVADMVRPGARWLSPLHWAWKNSAKARLIARVEGKGDVFHHLIAVNGFFDGVLRLLVDKSFRGRLQQFAIEKDGKKVFPVIRAFENAVPDMAFRFVKKE